MRKKLQKFFRDPGNIFMSGVTFGFVYVLLLGYFLSITEDVRIMHEREKGVSIL